ncbi:hypothetical protein PI124_g18752 [Phytophthora idaei]|nr:hypothetical protein PI124_g18752 [Phytophthora idaei]
MDGGQVGVVYEQWAPYESEAQAASLLIQWTQLVIRWEQQILLDFILVRYFSYAFLTRICSVTLSISKKLCPEGCATNKRQLKLVNFHSPEHHLLHHPPMRSLFCIALTILVMLLAATDAASSSISNFETTAMNARLTSTSPTPGLSANEKRNLCGATKKTATEEFNADDED